MEHKIKVGAVAWGLPGGGSYAAATAARAGLDGIQLELGSYAAGYPLAQNSVIQGYIEDRERYGIEYPALVLNDVMEHEFIHGRHTEHGRIAYDQIELGIQVAAELGIGKIMIPNFLQNLMTAPEHLEHTRDALAFACQRAREKDIMILTENALPAGQQRQMLQEINMPNLLVHFDTQNFKFNFDMDQCEQLNGLYDLMDNQLHAKDGLCNPGECLLGQGNTDFAKQMKILKERSFAGWIIIENYYNLLPLRLQGEQMSLLLKDVVTINECLRASTD